MNESCIARTLGTIVGGSLVGGLRMKFASGVHPESLKTGRFVCIKGSSYTYFSLITDIELSTLDEALVGMTPAAEQSKGRLWQSAVSHLFCVYAALKPMLALDQHGQHAPAKTVPAHGAIVAEATDRDIASVFGSEADAQSPYFAIGTPIDMHSPVCINLDLLSERSIGIFGKTGTGKTFLTRLILAGLVYKQRAVLLIFDMHNEYGIQARVEGATERAFVKGLKTLFPSQVAIFSLDPEATRRRGGNPDVTIRLPLSVIRVEDILSLQQELNLHATATEAAYLVVAHFKHAWLTKLFDTPDIADLAAQVGAHPESLAALQRKLRAIERLPFFYRDNAQEAGTAASFSGIDRMLDYINRGISIVIEFGSYTSTLSYLLIANIITRRLHKLYIQKVDAFLGSARGAARPHKLIIVIEEAHKFLNSSAARQTIFGTIAREMRKYSVSLLIVDQRPSSIDTDVLSQIGTKMIAQLNDEGDISAVLAGTAHAHDLRAIVSTLESKSHVLALGHALPMPLVLQSRPYDEAFYRAVAAGRAASGGTGQQEGVRSAGEDLDACIDGLYPS